MMLFVFLLFVLFFLSFEFLDVLVPDFPLGNFASEVVSDGRLCGSTFLLYVWVDGLDLSAFVVELVSHGLLDGLNIFA